MFKLLQQSLEKGAQAADIFYLERKTDGISFKYNKLDSITAKNTSGFALRVKKDGLAGIVSSSNFNRNEEVLQMALEASKEGSPLEYDLTTSKELPNLTLTNDSLWERSVEEYIADGERAIKLIHEYDPNISVGVGFSREREVKGYFNTFGCDYTSSRDTLGFGIDTQLVQGNSVLENYESVNLKSNDYSVEDLANKLIDQIKIGRIEKNIEPGKMPVLLTPGAVAQLVFVITAGLSGENVRLGISPLKGKVGEQIFSDKITLIDDMTLMEAGDTSIFDDEGTPAQRTVLFEKGILKNYLLHQKSAHALGLEPNGKASRRYLWKSREYAMTPTPRYSNWLMSPGNTTLEEMIGDIKEGFVIEDMFGLIMGNLVAGEVTSDIDLGYKIENGQIVGRVKDAAIGVNIYDVLKNNILAIENKCGSTNMFGNTMYLPHILLKDINIVR